MHEDTSLKMELK